MPTKINMNAVSAREVMNFRTPCEGAKVIPLQLDFSTAPVADLTFTVDLQQMEQTSQFSMLQSIYVDLSGTDVPLTITITDVRQVIVCKGRTNGYYSVCAPNPTLLTFSVPVGGATPVIIVELINSPVPGMVWATQ